MDVRKTPLLPQQYYHVYNRGVNGQAVFFEEDNYQYFLKLYDKYLSVLVETYAYCLLKNHFHIFIKTCETEKISTTLPTSDKDVSWHLSNGFASLFQAYTRAINNRYQRTGPLFEKPFKRIEVSDNSYISALIAYIHKNPEKHKLNTTFDEYRHSSYRSFISNLPTKLEREKVLDWFGGKDEFVQFHKEYKIRKSLSTFE